MKGNARQPNLFIVGAAKCGTTSMHEYLAQHPGIFMSTWKEPHYFAPDLKGRFDWTVNDLDRYLELFSNASHEAYLGESSVGYLYSQEAPTRIKEFCPDARIVIMLRDPVEAICSMFYQHVVQGNESIFDLKSALDAEPKRIEGDVPSFIPFRYWLYYKETFTYAPQVKRYFDCFGRDSVRVIIFDDLKLDPRVEFDRLVAWLGLPECKTIEFGTRNAAIPPRNYEIKRLLLRYPRLTKALYDRIGPEFRQKMGSILAAINPFGSPVPKITEEAKTELAAGMRRDVDLLESLLDRPLENWCRHGSNKISRAETTVKQPAAR